MYKKTLTYSILIIVSILFSCSEEDPTPEMNAENTATTETGTDTSSSSNTTASNTISVADEIFALVNTHRQGLGLPALQKNGTAEQLAVDHTLYMIAEGDISHDDFDARFDNLKANENARGASENVASFYPDAQSVMEGWLNSEGHRNNIEGNFSKIGIAAIKDSAGRFYYTQLFFR